MYAFLDQINALVRALICLAKSKSCTVLQKDFTNLDYFSQLHLDFSQIDIISHNATISHLFVIMQTLFHVVVT